MSNPKNGQWTKDHERGWALVEQQKYNEALDVYSKLAEADSPVAQDVLGWMYLTGRGVTKDLGRAKQWFEMAAAAEYAWGEYHLGYAALVEQRFEAARQWFEKASSRGHSTATYRLGLLYLHGQGVRTNEDQAYALFGVAASKGHVLARRDMLRILARRSNTLLLRSWYHLLIAANFLRALPIILKDPHDERLDLS